MTRLVSTCSRPCHGYSCSRGYRYIIGGGRGKRPVTVHRSRTSNDVLFANAPAAQSAASAASPDDRVVVEIGHQDAHSVSVGYPVPLAYVDEHGKLIDRRYALHGIHLDMTIFVQN